MSFGPWSSAALSLPAGASGDDRAAAAHTDTSSSVAAHPIADDIKKRDRRREKNHEAELAGHVGVRFAATTAAANTNLPKLTTSMPHAMTSSASVTYLGFGSSSARRHPSVVAAAAAAAGPQTERGTRRISSATGTTRPLPAMTSPRAGASSHFPVAASSLPTAPGMGHVVTHPRFTRLLVQAEEARARDEESKSHSPAHIGNKRRPVVPSSQLVPPPTNKINLANVDHFDAVQQQIQEMVNGTMEGTQTNKQPIATLAALSLAHSQRAAKLLAEFKSRYAAMSSHMSVADVDRLRFFESAYPEAQQAVQRERDAWEQTRNEWTASYEQLAHKYHALLQHTGQISRVVREQAQLLAVAGAAAQPTNDASVETSAQEADQQEENRSSLADATPARARRDSVGSAGADDVTQSDAQLAASSADATVEPLPAQPNLHLPLASTPYTVHDSLAPGNSLSSPRPPSSVADCDAQTPRWRLTLGLQLASMVPFDEEDDDPVAPPQPIHEQEGDESSDEDAVPESVLSGVNVAGESTASSTRVWKVLHSSGTKEAASTQETEAHTSALDGNESPVADASPLSPPSPPAVPRRTKLSSKRPSLIGATKSSPRRKMSIISASSPFSTPRSRKLHSTSFAHGMSLDLADLTSIGHDRLSSAATDLPDVGDVGDFDAEDALSDFIGSAPATPPSRDESVAYAAESVEAVSERWKGRLLKLRVQLSRAQSKNEALAALLKTSNERNAALTAAAKQSQQRQARLQEEVAAATRTGAELLTQMRVQTSSRRKDLILKLTESELELVALREELLHLRESQIDQKQQAFTIGALRNDIGKHVKKADRAHAAAEKWKEQMEESLQLVQQLQAELVATKEDHHAALRKLKKRLVLKSIWFRTQLIKLERLQELCLRHDEYMRPELTCPSCLSILKYPQSLMPCQHAMCANCVNTLKHDRPQGGGIECAECHRQCESTAPNFILEGILARYHHWQMLMKDFYSSKALTLQQEHDLKHMIVKPDTTAASHER